ncbi:Uncharacterised protein [Mycobacteroides abscessus subsp. abscessus]|nr:Uncharacterised protein [Mycobacteroides abscessus subsp. abscessus]
MVLFIPFIKEHEHRKCFITLDLPDLEAVILHIALYACQLCLDEFHRILN